MEQGWPALKQVVFSVTTSKVPLYQDAHRAVERPSLSLRACLLASPGVFFKGPTDGHCVIRVSIAGREAGQSNPPKLQTQGKKTLILKLFEFITLSTT